MIYALIRTHQDTLAHPTLHCWGFEGVDQVDWLSPEPLQDSLPRRLTVMHNDLEAVADYPLNELNYPIWSDRMVQAVASTGQLDAELIEVSVVDDYEPTRRRDDFKAVHLLRKVEAAIDYEASEYRAQRYDERLIRAFGKLVLLSERIPDTPAFRLVESPGLTLLSEAAAQRLLALDLKGATVRPLGEVQHRW